MSFSAGFHQWERRELEGFHVLLGRAASETPAVGVGTSFLLLHGTGGDEEDLVPLGERLLPAADLISPRGRVREGHGPMAMNRWFARLAPGVLDENDIRRRAAELEKFIPAALHALDPAAGKAGEPVGPGRADEHAADLGQLSAGPGRAQENLWAQEDRPGVLGFSNGANMAAAQLFLNPGLYSAAVLLRPMLPFVEQKPVDLSGVKIYLAAGSRDRMIPVESTRRLESLLRESGADLTVRWAEADHGLLPAEIEELAEWLKVLEL